MTSITESGSKPIDGKRNKPEKPELIDKESRLRELFRLSFMISQGSSGAQRHIFRWLKLKGHLEEFEIGSTPPKFILDISPPKTHPTKDPVGNKLSSSSNKETLKREWGWLRRAKNLTASGMERPKSPIPMMLDHILDKEIQFQIDGRPHRTPDKQYESLLRNWLILNQPIEHDVYQQLLDEIKPYLFTLHDRIGRLPVLESYWERNHRGEYFFPTIAAA